MRGGILGLFIALTLVASVSVGLSLAPSQNAELCIDFCISISACLAVKPKLVLIEVEKFSPKF